MTFRSIPTADGSLIRGVVNPDGTTLAPLHAVQDAEGTQINPATDETVARVATAIDGVRGYETVAASQTDQVLGGSGAAGDVLQRLIVIPTSTSPGAISIKDGAGSAMTLFAGGASSLASLATFHIDVGMKSAAGAWKLTTGSGLSVIAIGKFT